MRFVDGMKGLTPILGATPPLTTVREKPSNRGGNAAVFSEGIQQHMAWAYERPDGGRGFGFTGLHRHDNLSNKSFRTLLVNAVAWIVKLKIPKDGVRPKNSKQRI